MGTRRIAHAPCTGCLLAVAQVDRFRLNASMPWTNRSTFLASGLTARASRLNCG
jgi:hypothetical protein